MRPFLIQYGDFSIPPYTFLIMVGALAAVWFGYRQCKRLKLPLVYALDMGMLAIIFGFVGGRIAHVLIEAPGYYWEDPWRVFYFWQGGFVSFGAHIGIALSWIAYLKWRKESIWTYFDLAAMSTCFTEFFGRMGCLFVGCCYGKPTDFWLSLTFHNPAATAYDYHPNISLHATQPYLMLNALLIFGVLYYLYKKHWHFQGQLISLWVIIYACNRTWIEFLRGDADRGVYFNGLISSAQLAMIGYAVLGLVMYKLLSSKKLPPPIISHE